MNEQQSIEYWMSSLRHKWKEVPGAVSDRHKTNELFNLSGKDLLEFWIATRNRDTTGARFPVRGWYHELYKDILRGKKVLEVGSGLGIDGITFAQHGAHVTFVDIVETNLKVVQRVCSLLNLNNTVFHYMETIASLELLDANYDAVWAQGSLINAPFKIIQEEVHEILKHLKQNGRWIELAYPESRWKREGCMPFDKWGERTDGAGTPWVEWYDLNKMKALFNPINFDVVLYFEFHNNDFNWFDLLIQK